MNNQQNVQSTARVPATFAHIAVLGGGAWGTALAVTAARAGRRVTLWAMEDDVRRAIREARENTRFLPGIALPETIETIDHIAETHAADAVLIASPAQYMRATLAALAGAIRPGTPVVICAKGLERGSGRLMTEMLAEALPTALCAVLSGPSFADDVARGLPTAVSLAASDLAVAERLAASLRTPAFRPYAGPDPIGAAVGGAVKNVLAIACGVTEGKGLGASAKAALIARGFAEMRRFAVALGARADTLAGLSGLGDLVLTCSTAQSRNFAYGLAIGAGADAAGAAETAKGVVEGVATARPVLDRAAALGVEMPIVAAVTALVEGRLSVDQAIAGLLNRPPRLEHE